MELLTLSYFLLLGVELAALFLPVPFHLHMIVASVLCIYIGAHFSTQRGEEVRPRTRARSVNNVRLSTG
jgi:hypothetical protein